MTSMDNTPDSPAKTPGGYTTQGGNFWTLITPEIWKVLHAVLQQLLIIDDFGIGGIDVHLGPILLDIIDQQSMQGSLLITSQFPHEKWYDLFNDPTVADAILDRIVHRAHFMNLKGESMRKVLAKKT